MKKSISITLFLIAALGLSTPGWSQNLSKKKVQKALEAPSQRAKANGPAYATRDDALRWADDVAARRDLDPEWVRLVIGQARFLPGVPRLVLPPPKGTAKNWKVYRSRFIDPTRIRAGVAFWQANRAALERAEKEFGVPAEIIVGIIGVETIYGQQLGSYRVLDALATLAFRPATPARRRARRSSATSWSSSCRWLTAPAPTRSIPSAALPARWACRSSCRRVWRSTRPISTATAASTSPAARPM